MPAVAAERVDYAVAPNDTDGQISGAISNPTTSFSIVLLRRTRRCSYSLPGTGDIQRTPCSSWAPRLTLDTAQSAGV